MNTNSNLSGLILLSALSSTSISLDYKISDLAFSNENEINFITESGQNWSYDSIASGNYNFGSETDRVNIIYKFSKELILNSETLDNEFSKIVDDNFFDLL